MAIIGTGEEGYFVPPTKGTSPAQVSVEQLLPGQEQASQC